MDSQAQDWATILYEASASGNPDVISLLLEYGADANIPKHTGHLPIHRVAHRGYVKYEAFLTIIEISNSMQIHNNSACVALFSIATRVNFYCRILCSFINK